MGKTFQKIHGCSVGNFENNGDKIPQWIKANGGKYTKDITAEVTHLITTKEAYKKNVEAVREAKRVKSVKIVTYDWLEDSLLSKSRRPKKEGRYLLNTVFKGEKEKKGRGKGKGKDAPKGKRGPTKAQTQTLKKRKRAGSDSLDLFENSCLSLKTKMEALNYHLYTDKTTNTTYSVTLVRPTIHTNHKERYLLKTKIFTTQAPFRGYLARVPTDNPRAQQIQVFQSNRAPHVYTAYVKYSRVGASATHLLAPLGSNLDFAMKAFTKFFKLKTGREWGERVDEMKPLQPKVDDEGNILPAHEGWYMHENQMGLLTCFLRLGPGGCGGEGSAGRPDGGSEPQERREEGGVSGSMDEAGKSGDGGKDGSSEEMEIAPDELGKEAGVEDGKSVKSGSSMEQAIMID